MLNIYGFVKLQNNTTINLCGEAECAEILALYFSEHNQVKSIVPKNAEPSECDVHITRNGDCDSVTFNTVEPLNSYLLEHLV